MKEYRRVWKMFEKRDLALANNTDDFAGLLAMENELKIDADGWALIAPYGEHPKQRMVVRNGAVQSERFIQVFDDAVADTVLASERGGIFKRLIRAVVKRPIYRGHPDLKIHSPETLANSEPLTPIGIVGDWRKTERGLEFKPELVPAGAQAVENEGCKYPSIYWWVAETGEVRNGAKVVKPTGIISVGLTAHNNISGVDSLANANATKPAATTDNKTQNENHMKSLLLGWLAAQGIALANDATDQAVLEAFSKEWLTRGVSITSLSNEKVTLTANLKAERLGRAQAVADLALAQGKLKAEDREAKVTALANSTDFDKDAKALLGDKVIISLENAATEFRKKSIEATVDLVITQGRLAVADRETKVTELVALANEKLDEVIKTLKAAPVKFQVGASALSGERKADADKAQSAQQKILALANSDSKYKDIKDITVAFARIKEDHPALFEELNTTKPAAATK